jgi:hypothetical protein
MKWKGSPILGRCVEERPIWEDQDQMTRIKEAMLRQGKTRVAHYWNQEDEHDELYS